MLFLYFWYRVNLEEPIILICFLSYSLVRLIWDVSYVQTVDMEQQVHIYYGEYNNKADV